MVSQKQRTRFSTLKILATVKPRRSNIELIDGFSTLKILATVKRF